MISARETIRGSIFGARGPHGYFARKTALSRLVQGRIRQNLRPRALRSERMRQHQGIFGIKAAYEKAAGEIAAGQAVKTEAVIAGT